ncbi:ras guanine nucleotide exchange factor domain-containing protein, partial [Dimargaris cristalligena]
KPWFMSYDYHHDDITFNEHGQIITGTMEALVERLTLHDCSVDSEYISTFLLTFRSFCTPIRFLDILMTRFHLTPPEELTDSEHAEWAQQKKIPVRLRVINVIKTWLESYFFDDEDVACIQPLHEFIESTLRDTMSSSANRLAQLVESKQDCLNPDSSSYASIPDTPPPSPRLQRSILHSLLDGLPISIYDIEPLEIARQLTLMDGRLFGAIRPHELIGQEFSKKDLSTATNVRAMTARSNRITAWVVVSVLSEPELKRRASALKYFLKVADALLILNNYNTLMAVACGLVYSAISRLHLTWKSLSGKYATLMKTLDSITDPDRNFATYRARIRQQPPPCLPFLGVYLTDLTFTDDGNQTFRRQSSADRNTAEESPKSFINFHKYFQTVRIIKEIQGFQVPYNLKDVPELQQHLLGDFERCFAHFEPASLYDISLRLEPRK